MLFLLQPSIQVIENHTYIDKVTPITNFDSYLFLPKKTCILLNYNVEWYSKRNYVNCFYGFLDFFATQQFFSLYLSRHKNDHFINVLRKHFSYEICAPKVTKLCFGFVTREKLLNSLVYEKRSRVKCWWNWHLIEKGIFFPR